MIAEYINTHHAEFWMILGFSLLVLEVVTGLTTGVLLFGGLAALVTGLLMLMGVLPETWIAGVASTGILSGVIATLLWKQLRKLQGDREPTKDNSSDLVGYEFVAQQDITSLDPGVTQYSGIEWKVEIDKTAGVDKIAAGQHVVVVSVDVAKFRVKPI